LNSKTQALGGMAAGLVLVVGIVAATASGCSSTSKANQPYLDSGNNGADTKPAITIAMPDGFSNVAVKCVGAESVWTGYHGDDNRIAMFVVPADPNCHNGVYVDPNIVTSGK
jgi:hypothetical protein